jgi:aldose sugar dehydrogenase
MQMEFLLTLKLYFLFLFLLAGAQVAYPLLLNGIYGNGLSNTNKVTLSDPSLKIETVFQGLKFPTGMTFLGPNDILVIEKNDGTVKRILNGSMLPEPLLKLNVSTSQERGLLGIASAHNNKNSTYVFLYYSASKTQDGQTPFANQLYRYELAGNRLINPFLIYEAPIFPGPQHNGGKIVIGPDQKIYLVTGDLNPHANESIYTQADNHAVGSAPDGRGGILRLSLKNSSNETNGILGSVYPLNMYYAYGIRNSFGMDFDPVTGKLWDTENGVFKNDEINIVEPGFNSGWTTIQGMGPQHFEKSSLVSFDGKGKYSDPEFVWKHSVGPTAIKFINSQKLGKTYYNDLLVGDFHNGNLYHFELNGKRNGLDLNGRLSDMIADNMDELNSTILGKGFGGITDIVMGPDGYPYILAVNFGGPNCPVNIQKDNCVRYSSSLPGTIYRVSTQTN